ncbi:MAG: diadenylate cyclase CdaA [bacterium]
MELFKIGFISFGIVDFIDIAVVGLVAYKLLMMLRGTRGAPMLMGLGIILMASVVAQLLQLKALNWIISSIGRPVWLIALVILFQPELRRMLTHMGQSRFGKIFVKVKSFRELEEVIKAAFELSRRGCGALIVLARDTGLRGILETGTKIHAEVSTPLLVTLFTPPSPTQDGAVVIQEGMIEAAGCVLPLSQAPSLDASVGMRHRAALGLSEESDAVVVVVSEETGAVSTAIEGRITTHLDASSLRDELARLFTAAPTAESQD